MTQKVRFITIVALGFSVLTGTAATVTLSSPSPAATVLTADGTTGGEQATAGQPVDQPAASVASPSPTPTHQDTWGWG